MDGYELTTYGERIADVYDDWYGDRKDTGPAVAFLADLAGGRRVLELGVGTGRIAIPLAGRGVDVTGVDSSPAMLHRLRQRPGGERVRPVVGDFADVAVEGRFGVVYAAFCTFFALLNQEEQIRCLRNVADHLEPGGRFALDAFVPDLGRFTHDQAVVAEHAGTDAVRIDASRHDPVHQRVDSCHVVLTEAGIRMYPVALRYAWPAELDAMALAAGLVLESRLGGYDRRPFDATSTVHVSVYRPAGG